MLVKCTKATASALLGRKFFPHSFRPPQAKLHTWSPFMRERSPPQARHQHLDAKGVLKSAIEDIEEGAKKDWTPWQIAKWVGTGIVGGVLLEYGFVLYYNDQKERTILHAFEQGSCPKPNVTQEQLIYRKDIIKELTHILKPLPYHGSYHIVVGNHGTGKTTVVRQCARDVGEGVIYVQVPPKLDRFTENFARAIGYSFDDYVSFLEALKRKIQGNGGPTKRPKFSRVLDAFERGAKKYKEKHGRPPVLILDHISKLGHKDVAILEDLQDIAKDYADETSCVIVFVCSEGMVPRIMSLRSSWSRADKEPMVIGDVTKEEAFDYLHNKLGIEEKVTNQLVQFVGGRIRHLKEYGDKLLHGETIENVRKIMLSAVEQNFHQACIMKGEVNHAIGKRIIQELMKNEKIHFNAFVELVGNQKTVDALLQANVFSYNPASKMITFQSPATEVFLKENPEIFSKRWFFR